MHVQEIKKAFGCFLIVFLSIQMGAHLMHAGLLDFQNLMRGIFVLQIVLFGISAIVYLNDPHRPHVHERCGTLLLKASVLGLSFTYVLIALYP